VVPSSGVLPSSGVVPSKDGEVLCISWLQYSFELFHAQTLSATSHLLSKLPQTRSPSPPLLCLLQSLPPRLIHLAESLLFSTLSTPASHPNPPHLRFATLSSIASKGSTGRCEFGGCGSSWSATTLEIEKEGVNVGTRQGWRFGVVVNGVKEMIGFSGGFGWSSTPRPCVEKVVVQFSGEGIAVYWCRWIKAWRWLCSIPRSGFELFHAQTLSATSHLLSKLPQTRSPSPPLLCLLQSLPPRLIHLAESLLFSTLSTPASHPNPPHLRFATLSSIASKGSTGRCEFGGCGSSWSATTLEIEKEGVNVGTRQGWRFGVVVNGMKEMIGFSGGFGWSSTPRPCVEKVVVQFFNEGLAVYWCRWIRLWRWLCSIPRSGENVEKLQLLKTPKERQRRLDEIPVVHDDPKMDPSYDSDDESDTGSRIQETGTSQREYGSYGRGRDQFSARKGGLSSSDSWSPAVLPSNRERDSPRGLPGMGISPRGEGASHAGQFLNRSSQHQGADRALQHSNSWEKERPSPGSLVTEAERLSIRMTIMYLVLTIEYELYFNFY
ncbi:hypothetical protein Drorol1_Dr00016451, partial [Drosera rotundifolia]